MTLGLELRLVLREDHGTYEVLDVMHGDDLVTRMELAKPVPPGDWQRYIRAAGPNLEVGWEITPPSP